MKKSLPIDRIIWLLDRRIRKWERSRIFSDLLIDSKIIELEHLKRTFTALLKPVKLKGKK